MGEELHQKQLHNAQSALNDTFKQEGIDLQKMKRYQPVAYKNLNDISLKLLPEIMEITRAKGNVSVMNVAASLNEEEVKFLQAMELVSTLSEKTLPLILEDACKQGIQSTQIVNMATGTGRGK